MKRAVVAAALAVAAGFACADGGAMQQLATRQTRVVDAEGAIAAFAVDPTVVDVSVDAGRVVLLGRRGGDTVVTVVLAAGIRSFRVHVDPPVFQPHADGPAASGRTVLEARYDSALHRLTGLVSGGGRIGDSQVRVNAEVIRQLQPYPGEAATALPAATVEITNARRSVVLLDQFVQASPLTLDGVVLRGVHVKQGPWDFHAGIASWSPLQGFLSSGGERAATLSHTSGLGAVRVTPHLAWFPDSPGGAQALAAVTVEFGAQADPLHVRAHAGFGGRPAAAVEVDWRTPRRDAWLRASVRPQDLARLRAGPPPGTLAEGAWTERLDPATTLTVSGAASQLDIAQVDAQAASGRAELRHQWNEQWSGTLAAGGGTFRAGSAEGVRRGTVGAGVAWDTPHWGASAQYRYQATSLADAGGHGGRLSVRANQGGWRASAFIDAQQQAPTLDLLLVDRNDLARSLAGLGIAAAQPEDILRALRDNASLITGQHGLIGPVRLNPLRTHAGADVSWRGDGPMRPELGVRLLRDHVEGVVGARSSTVASLYGRWRLGDATDVSLTVSRWSTGRAGQERMGETGVQVSVRTMLDQPLIAPLSSAAITGQVFRADSPSDAGPSRTPLAGVEVVLDRGRRTRTDAEGRYSFERPGAGPHTIEALLPADGAAYFATPSMVSVDPGGQADFGIALGGARIVGTVRNDAGLPVQGVMVRAQGASAASAITDSAGAYRITLPPGKVRLSLDADSVPAGHNLRALAPREREVLAGQPATVNFVVRAMRSIDGTVAGTNGRPVSVTLLETGRAVETDAQGRFVMRGLPAGFLTLRVGSAGPAVPVTVPDAPGVVRGVVLQGS